MTELGTAQHRRNSNRNIKRGITGTSGAVSECVCIVLFYVVVAVVGYDATLYSSLVCSLLWCWECTVWAPSALIRTVVKG